MKKVTITQSGTVTITEGGNSVLIVGPDNKIEKRIQYDIEGEVDIKNIKAKGLKELGK